VNLRNGDEVRHSHDEETVAGTLACPACDAPVMPPHRLRVDAPLQCPYCAEAGAVRDFLTLGEPNRPARVIVRVTFARR
jgi:hypothetical protein